MAEGCICDEDAGLQNFINPDIGFIRPHPSLSEKNGARAWARACVSLVGGHQFQVDERRVDRGVTQPARHEVDRPTVGQQVTGLRVPERVVRDPTTHGHHTKFHGPGGRLLSDSISFCPGSLQLSRFAALPEKSHFARAVRLSNVLLQTKMSAHR